MRARRVVFVQIQCLESRTVGSRTTCRRRTTVPEARNSPPDR